MADKMLFSFLQELYLKKKILNDLLCPAFMFNVNLT